MIVSTVLVGLVFLISGAVVYAFNQESHDAKVVFALEHDHKVYGVGETETAVILLSLGVFFTVLGGLKWLRNNQSRRELEAFENADVPRDDARARGSVE
ncbi:MAG TPA: hypothetical protein DIU15_18420 [Deltaproteobacteria bacterium]|nr:hypothetical protein [Deltaproteobacteria bacterium]HCP48020.1 hypothetical protein [Deltaproteobacteria bacterium]